MTLSTVDGKGHPDARIVLLRDVDREGTGFLFYTNYCSAKGRQLTANPAAALTFFWPSLERQLRVRGGRAADSGGVGPLFQQSASPKLRRRVGVAAERGNRGSGLDWVSPGRGRGVFPMMPRPPHWGGYRLVADVVEFWQGRPGRLHDRIQHVLHATRRTQVRLQP